MPPAAAARAGPSPLMKPRPPPHPPATTDSLQHEQEQQQQQQEQQQRAGPSLLDRDGTAAGTSQKDDLRLQQRAGHGGEKGLQQQEGKLQGEEDFPGQGSRGAARELGKQPKALHAEQFPGNGAQVRTRSHDSCYWCAAIDYSDGPAWV